LALQLVLSFISTMYSLKDYHYHLPEDLIAQHPVDQRDRSRLLCLNRQTGEISHHRFMEIGDFLQPGDVLVINDTAVIPARLEGRKETGGKVEVLIADYYGGLESVRQSGDFVCQCLIKASKRPAVGLRLYFKEDLTAEVLDSSNGTHTLRFSSGDDFEEVLDRIGKVPLPPYIKRNTGDAVSHNDIKSYQTVYASHKGAIAAPTAGLHFTRKLLDQLAAKGIKIVPLTLHVGFGTFLPVRADDIRRHSMHSETFTISDESAAIIKAARTGEKKIIAVGTTCVRTLEYASDDRGGVASGSGSCDLFIYPGYEFKAIDAMITNFHLPQSTLLMLVSAFAGRQKILNAYQEAIDRKYRFYSYGDAMLIT
jgi:S-adenosylmethionine:tRNA ribosyltransferase-isomerase